MLLTRKVLYHCISIKILQTYYFFIWRDVKYYQNMERKEKDHSEEVKKTT